MLDAARRRGAERGLGNVEYRVIDAERIELDDDSVDGVLCRFGYMLMPDPAAALAETRRVLRPGGRVALAVWGAMERNPFFTIAGDQPRSSAATSRRLEPPGPPAVQHGERRAHRGAARATPDSPSVRTEEVPCTFDGSGRRTSTWA